MDVDWFSVTAGRVAWPEAISDDESPFLVAMVFSRNQIWRSETMRNLRNYSMILLGLKIQVYIGCRRNVPTRKRKVKRSKKGKRKVDNKSTHNQKKEADKYDTKDSPKNMKREKRTHYIERNYPKIKVVSSTHVNKNKLLNLKTNKSNPRHWSQLSRHGNEKRANDQGFNWSRGWRQRRREKLMRLW